VTGVRAAHGLERLRGAIHEVGAIATVNVQVHEPRCEVSTVEIDRVPAGGRGVDRGDAPVVDHDFCTVQQPVFEDHRSAAKGNRAHSFLVGGVAGCVPASSVGQSTNSPAPAPPTNPSDK
jgi:hypothetical protein